MIVLRTFPDGLSKAVYLTCRGHLDALASALHITRQRVANKANPNDAGHYFSPHELLTVQIATGDVQILHALAAALNHVAVPVRTVTDRAALPRRLAEAAAAEADLWRMLAGRIEQPAANADLYAAWERAASEALAAVREVDHAA